MLSLSQLANLASGTVLVLSAHPDDAEIGCGGTILRLIQENSQLAFKWIVLSGDKEGRKEAYASADIFLEGCTTKLVRVEDFRARYFPYSGDHLKAYFDRMGQEFSPGLVLAPRNEDRHQDHRFVNELTWQTFRRSVILEYEIPKYEGDLGQPNVYVPLSINVARAKVSHLLRTYRSQDSRYWFTEETFTSLLRIRGIESRSATGYAEGLYARKLVLH